MKYVELSTDQLRTMWLAVSTAQELTILDTSRVKESGDLLHLVFQHQQNGAWRLFWLPDAKVKELKNAIDLVNELPF